MGSGGGDTVVNNQQQRNVPEWVEKEGRALYNQAKDTAGKGPGNRIYPGERVAGWNPAQTQAMEHAQKSFGQYQPELNEVTGMHRKLAQQGPKRVGTGQNQQQIGFNRFTGSAPNSLFGQYYEKMYKPAAAELNSEAQRGMTQQRQHSAFGGKALGSQRALEQSQLEQGRLKQLQSLGSNVFEKAMGTFQTEEDRMMRSQMAQAGINEQDLSRKLQADLSNQTAGQQDKALNIKNAEGMLNNIAQKYNMNMKDILMMFNLGQQGQQQNQREIDSAMQKFNEMNNYDRLELEWLSNFLTQRSGGELSGKQTQTNPGMGTGEAFGAAALGALPLVASSFK